MKRLKLKRPDPVDTLGVVGVASLSGGTALIYLPAGVIVFGVLSLAAAWRIVMSDRARQDNR